MQTAEIQDLDHLLHVEAAVAAVDTMPCHLALNTAVPAAAAVVVVDLKILQPIRGVVAIQCWVKELWAEHRHIIQAAAAAELVVAVELVQLLMALPQILLLEQVGLDEHVLFLE